MLPWRHPRRCHFFLHSCLKPSKQLFPWLWNAPARRTHPFLLVPGHCNTAILYPACKFLKEVAFWGLKVIYQARKNVIFFALFEMTKTCWGDARAANAWLRLVITLKKNCFCTCNKIMYLFIFFYSEFWTMNYAIKFGQFLNSILVSRW